MTDHATAASQATAQPDANTLFASLELSKARWLVTVSALGSEKLSKHAVAGGDGGALLERVEGRIGASVRVVLIQGNASNHLAKSGVQVG